MILRLQVSTMGDTAFERDRMVITPHFATPTGMNEAQQMCGDLANALHTWMNDKREIRVKAYDAQGTVPVEPIGEATVQTGLMPVSTCPREVALCLSFFSGQNVKRKRGRLYIPHTWSGGTCPVRPSSATRDRLADLSAIFQELGGVDVDWVVYSRLNDASYPVTNWWVDDEWDTVRSRGMRATTRTSGTTSEA